MTKLNLGCGPHLLDGFDNLDAANGWRFEDGLGDYADGSVAGITISHSLMYVPASKWATTFKELARVLEPAGIVRITEDDTENEASERFGGWHDAVTLTSPQLVKSHLRKAKLVIMEVDSTTSMFEDGSLIQAWHGAPPKVFFCEGRKLAA